MIKKKINDLKKFKYNSCSLLYALWKCSGSCLMWLRLLLSFGSCDQFCQDLQTVCPFSSQTTKQSVRLMLSVSLGPKVMTLSRFYCISNLNVEFLMHQIDCLNSIVFSITFGLSKEGDILTDIQKLTISLQRPHILT